MIAIYADRLQRRGHEVTIVSQPRGLPRFLGKVKSLVRGRGWPRELESESSYFNIVVPHHVLETARPVMDHDVPDADIVLATYWRTAPSVLALSPAKGVKAIFLQGYEISSGQEDPEMDAVWGLPLHKIVISEWLVELAKNRFGDPNVHLVPNGVDMEQFHATARGKHATPTIGMLYSTAHLKGLDVSLAALERVKQRMKNLRVIAFGTGRATAQLPLPEWVEYHHRPPQDKIPQLYGQCDVWLCGSRREGFHLPALEAMACRCPVVSTRCGGPSDFVKEGINGFLVDVEDSVRLADRLVRVLTFSEPEWRRMSDAALATAERYSWDDATDLLESALNDLVAPVRVE